MVWEEVHVEVARLKADWSLYGESRRPEVQFARGDMKRSQSEFGYPGLNCLRIFLEKVEGSRNSIDVVCRTDVSD